MRLDDEVLAVIMALIVVSSVFAAAMTIPRGHEEFLAIGLLNENCKIGDYPKTVFVEENITLCIFVSNNLAKPALLQVRFKLGSRNNLPTNTTYLNSPTILSLTRVLNSGGNFTEKVSFKLNSTGENVALVFELWKYDTELGKWVYTGRWVHLYVNVTRVFPG